MSALSADPKLRSVFETLRPGLIAAVETMRGQFIVDWIHPTCTYIPSKGTTILFAHISFAYRLEDNSLLRIEERIKIDNNSQVVTKLSYHYGPDYLAPSDAYFRIDYAIKTDRLHIHIHGYKGHIYPDACTPSITDIDAYKFIEIVKQYRVTKKLPFRRRA